MVINIMNFVTKTFTESIRENLNDDMIFVGRY